MNKTKAFVPIQPEFNQKTKNYIEQKNMIGSSGILYYQFETEAADNCLLSVVPDGCIDFLFCRSASFSKITIHGSRLQQSALMLEQNALYFGVRLMPHDRLQSPAGSMKELLNSDVDVNDWLGQGQASALEQVIHEASFQGKIVSYEKLMAASPVRSSAQTLVDYVLQKIQRSKGKLNLEALAEETGYTSRYVRKQFEQHVGMPPKLFCKITRFQHALSMLIDRQSPSEVLESNGYYDQAQMIHEFKRFGNTTPHQLFQSLHATS